MKDDEDISFVFHHSLIIFKMLSESAKDTLCRQVCRVRCWWHQVSRLVMDWEWSGSDCGIVNAKDQRETRKRWGRHETNISPRVKCTARRARTKSGQLSRCLSQRPLEMSVRRYCACSYGFKFELASLIGFCLCFTLWSSQSILAWNPLMYRGTNHCSVIINHSLKLYIKII